MENLYSLVKSLLIHAACWSVFAFFGPAAFAQGPGQVSPDGAIPQVLVFKLKADQKSNARLNTVQGDSFAKAFKTLSAERVTRKFPDEQVSAQLRKAKPGAVDLSLIYELKFDSQLSFEKAKKVIEATQQVEYVEPLYYRDVLAIPNDPMADALLGSQYYLKLIDAYRGWEVEKGDTNVVVGIVDTGVRFSHEDLKNKVKFNYADPIDGIDNDGDGFVDNFRGWDTADNDNDPSADNTGWVFNGHGISVTGVAAAETNNGKGIASVGYNTKYLPVKAYTSKEGGRFGGYEGILYAANHGCKVINLSWGGVSMPSAFEQDIINYAAINKDVVIVAAAGNTNAELNFYPASYDNVLSVGMTDHNDIKAGNGTYGYKIDLMAPGQGMQTTNDSKDDAYAGAGGSSFASPVAAACAALVRSRMPHLNSRQVAEQLRVTTDNIYELPGNAPFQDMLGSGRVNLYRALTETNKISVRNTAVAVNDEKQMFPGKSFAVTGEFTNYLTPTQNLEVTLTSSSPYVRIIQNSFAGGSMGTMATRRNSSSPFLVQVLENIPVNEKVVFKLSFRDGSYTDFQYFRLTLNPDILTLNINQLAVTVNSKGNFGYDGFNYNRGVGVTYKNGRSLLTEGGLMIGTSATRVSDNLRNEKFTTDEDFRSLQNLRPLATSSADAFQGTGIMRDSSVKSQTVGVMVTHSAYAWNNELEKSFVILEYTITNTRPDTLRNLYTGLFADWDIGNPNRNLARWDEENQMGYVFNKDTPTEYAGLKLLSGKANYYAIDFMGGAAGTISLMEGFTTDAKYRSLSSGTTNKSAGLNGQGNDVAHVVSSACDFLAPGQSIKVAFAIIGADNLTDLRASAAISQARYDALRTSNLLPIKEGSKGEETFTLYPNPSAGQVAINLPASLQAGGVTSVEVYNLVGERVHTQTLQQEAKPSLDLANLAPGMYLVRVQGKKGTMTQKLQIKR